MSMIRKVTPIALAIAALCSAPAFAAPVAANATALTGQVSLGNSFTEDDSTNSATLNDTVLQHASGNIGVNNAAGSANSQGNSTAIAVVDHHQGATAVAGSAQIAVGSSAKSIESNTNNATINDQVLEDASGNVAVNNAAGDGNQQSNSLAISVNNKEHSGLADADTLGIQLSNSNFVAPDASGHTTNNASLNNDVLENASGNVVVSNAAGFNNQQGNEGAIAVSDNGLAHAFAGGLQVSLAGKYAAGDGVNNNASLSNEVLQNASGNVGVNNAAGAGNQQLNSMSIAVSQ